MAFFNLTQLGVQDPINSAVKLGIKNSSNDNSVKNITTATTASSTTTATTAQSPIYNTEAQGSYVKYTERLTKHQRTEKDPNELYSKPITSSQDYGWWKQDGAPKSLPWTEAPHHSRVNSEMTRFVDEMTLTNKHFTLF